jgi:spore coat polysaccharide biosynthesis protein SpsF (cytidylyltransferase family)
MNKEQKICALIAVRMKSKRLPKKALVDIEGYTAIERVVNNLKPSKYIDEIILATTTNSEDDPIEKLAKNKGLPFFRGDEDNVVKRFIDAAEKFNADIVVRVTGDCPLVSFEIADYHIADHLKKGADYTSNNIDDPPIGTGSEVINLSALKKLTTVNVDLNYSEYMTFYFRNNPKYFSINIVSCPKEYCRPNYRLTLDYPNDLEFFRVVFKHFQPGSGAIPLAKTISFLDEHPEVVAINKNSPLKWKSDQKLIKKLENATKIKNETSKVGR